MRVAVIPRALRTCVEGTGREEREGPAGRRDEFVLMFRHGYGKGGPGGTVGAGARAGAGAGAGPGRGDYATPGLSESLPLTVSIVELNSNGVKVLPRRKLSLYSFS